MTRALYWTLWSATALLVLTGLGYAGVKYLAENDDPFSAYGHPSQPWLLAAHVLAAPALVLALGWAWGAHAAPKLAGQNGNGGTGRRLGLTSGLVNVALGLVMIFSGYWMQVTASESLRVALGWVHGLSGVAFAATLALHAVLTLARVRNSRYGLADGSFLPESSRPGRSHEPDIQVDTPARGSTQRMSTNHTTMNSKPSRASFTIFLRRGSNPFSRASKVSTRPSRSR